MGKLIHNAMFISLHFVNDGDTYGDLSHIGGFKVADSFDEAKENLNKLIEAQIDAIDLRDELPTANDYINYLNEVGYLKEHTEIDGYIKISYQDMDSNRMEYHHFIVQHG